MVWDLTGGTAMGFQEFDVDGDATEIHVTLPVDPDVDHDSVSNVVDNCPHVVNFTQHDGDGDGTGTVCDDVDRVWGANRYGTSGAVAEMAFDTAHEVFIALGTNFPDALVAAAAAGHRDAPVLLTGFDSLPQETITELVRLGPATAYVVGGAAAIAPSVEARLQNYAGTVVRLAGPDRYATAAAVSEAIFPTASQVFIALGTNFPDALVSAAAAGSYDSPVLLTAGDHVPQATLDELARLSPDIVYIVGGTGAISETVAIELAPYAAISVVRVAGTDRYATAAEVATRFFNFTMTRRAFLAYGGDFPDALVAAAAGANLGAPVLLVTHDSIPSATRQALDDLIVTHHWLVGGPAVISQDVFDALP
jgi:putative cell wall-binding protein